jgi:translation elongation factor EF-G
VYILAGEAILHSFDQVCEVKVNAKRKEEVVRGMGTLHLTNYRLMFSTFSNSEVKYFCMFIDNCFHVLSVL